MPYATDFYGSLSTDKPMPETVQQHIEFLYDLDIRTIAAPLQDPLGTVVPEGFPVCEVAELAAKGVYTLSLCARSDTELAVADIEYPALDAVSLQVVIDAFLKPHGIKATGRIEAAGESGVGDLWCLVVGEDQVVRTYDGTVVYEDQPAHPTGGADAVRELGARLLEWASVDVGDTDTLQRFIKAAEFSTIPEAAADISASFPPAQAYCDECGAPTQETYESAPGDFHDPSCSLYTEPGRVRNTYNAAITEREAALARGDYPAAESADSRAQDVCGAARTTPEELDLDRDPING